jgi:cytochrome b pre-mRNA-processing protein 3
LKLPDSFISWFLITELHIWMLMTKCTVLEDKGRYLRNAVVKTFWDDSLVRMKQIQVTFHQKSVLEKLTNNWFSYLQPSGTNKVIQDLGQQFRAALFSYDEGIQSSDIVLANSLWRRFYSTGIDFRPEEIELLVSYVRRQVINQWHVYQENEMLKYFVS